MTRPYEMRSSDGYSDLTPPFSDTIVNIALAANTAVTVNWPAGTSNCNISAPSPYWVAAAGQTAQIPTTSITNGQGSAYCPAQRRNFGDAGFSIISATAQVISVEFWR